MNPVLVVGSSVVDLTFYADRIPVVGETVTGRFVQGLGGKGFNQAVASAKAGAPTQFLSAVGPDETDAFTPLFRSRLKELSIPHSLESVPGQATGAAAISVDRQGRNNIIVSLGANESLSPAFLESQAASFVGISVLLLQFETCFEAVSKALQLARAKSPKALTILNPAPALADVPAELLAQVDLLTPNETELAALAGREVRDEKDVLEACRKIQGPGAILATLGEKGCYYYRRGEGRAFPAFPVEAKDTSGAGDAFNGGFAAGWSLTHGDLDRSIRYASAVAALSVTRPGTSASMPTREEVEAFLR